MISDDFAGFGTTRRCHNGWFILDDIFDFSELSERVCAFQLLDNPTRDPKPSYDLSNRWSTVLLSFSVL